MKKVSVLAAALVAASISLAEPATAAVNVGWIAPPDGTSYAVGTVVGPTGQAGASGSVGGSGLDLMLVMDSSGSMRGTRQAAQKDAFLALVDALPTTTTAVGVVEFDSDANLIRVLSQLTTDINAVKAAINSVDASGGTNIGSGIDAAKNELISSRHTTGRSQMMVVSSDGYTSGNPELSALLAMTAGVDAIHTVGLPGHNVGTMRDIVDGPDDSYGNGDDYGVYTDATDMSGLTAVFDGTGGSLVGIDHVDIVLPDLTTIDGIAVDGLGNFVLPAWTMAAGANVFQVTAYNTAGESSSATLTLYGTSAVPEPASVLAWCVLGIVGVSIVRSRHRRSA